jgi:hypothetical protein
LLWNRQLDGLMHHSDISVYNRRGDEKLEEASLSDIEREGLRRGQEFRGKGQAYLLMQDTVPYVCLLLGL